MNVVQKTVFDIACDMESPLSTIDDLLEALALIGETINDGGSAVIRLAMLAQEQCKALEAARAKVFHLTHPGITIAA